MNSTILFQGYAGFGADALVFPAIEGSAPQTGNAAVDEWASDLYASGEFSGKSLETALLYKPAGLEAKRVLLIGLGKGDTVNSAVLRRVAGAALRTLKAKSILKIGFVLAKEFQQAAYAQALLEGAVAADFEPDEHKSKKDAKHAESFTILAEGGSSDLAEAARNGAVIGEAQNFTRALVNEPGNLLTPTVLAARAKAMAEENGLDVDILDEDRMRQLGMGSLLAVAQGSAEPPAMIVLHYKPADAKPGTHLGLIGKGVTFDTGGISIKPSESMEKMKYDMAGGAAVIGAMMAIAKLQPKVEVTAVIPTVENMPGSRAVRPGDIVTSLAGKTIEVLNTDAEGRLILIDAITYAKRLGVTLMIDAATLTGAITVALGAVNVGLFSNDGGWQQQVLDSSKEVGEKMWPMPMDDEYKELLKNAFADMPNIGSRGAGSITAALFLKEWVEDTPWVHLDIAGTAWIDEAKPFLAKGPTGVGMRTFIEVARRLAN
ncbi:leucyl aminopeptidase [Bryobacter aggregatus]|uniref:leucyl aminopeptidase n=1 Tax=Bryobacter aggregatus TaxID=360054 RepID=UPI0004E1F06B|nr:leucyl aminopeptidase [Bryobacter aggregatus]